MRWRGRRATARCGAAAPARRRRRGRAGRATGRACRSSARRDRRPVAAASAPASSCLAAARGRHGRRCGRRRRDARRVSVRPVATIGAMGRGRPPAHAADRGLPRARRHRGGDRHRHRRAGTGAAGPARRGGAGRSASTTPTTTPTASAAPTTTASGRCGWSAPGWPRPATVRTAAFVCFAVAALAGLTLVALSGQWWLLAVGAVCIAGAWFYTGGRRPYGYAGLGEVAVFVFFGPVAVLGTVLTQSGPPGALAVVGAVGVGLLACAVLVANNLRDIPTDAVVGQADPRRRARRHRHPPAVRRAGRGAVPALGRCRRAQLADAAGLLALPLAVAAARRVLGGARGSRADPGAGATPACYCWPGQSLHRRRPRARRRSSEPSPRRRGPPSPSAAVAAQRARAAPLGRSPRRPRRARRPAARAGRGTAPSTAAARRPAPPAGRAAAARRRA